MRDASNDLKGKKNKLTKTYERVSKKQIEHVRYDKTGTLKDEALYA